MLLAAGLADGTSIISNIKISRDIEATIDCLRALGASVEMQRKRKHDPILPATVPAVWDACLFGRNGKTAFKTFFRI